MRIVRFEVDAERQVVIHHIEAASLPNRFGSRQECQYSFADDTLLLRSPPRLLGGQWLSGAMLWRRAQG